MSLAITVLNFMSFTGIIGSFDTREWIIISMSTALPQVKLQDSYSCDSVSAIANTTLT